MFARLSVAATEQVASRLLTVEVPGGAILMRRGDAGDRFYILVDGAVELERDGRPITIDKPGDYLGEIALVRDVPRTATVTASVDSRLYALERADFLDAVSGHSAGLAAVDAVVAERFRGPPARADSGAPRREHWRMAEGPGPQEQSVEPAAGPSPPAPGMSRPAPPGRIGALPAHELARLDPARRAGAVARLQGGAGNAQLARLLQRDPAPADPAAPPAPGAAAAAPAAPAQTPAAGCIVDDAVEQLEPHQQRRSQVLAALRTAAAAAAEAALSGSPWASAARAAASRPSSSRRCSRRTRRRTPRRSSARCASPLPGHPPPPRRRHSWAPSPRRSVGAWPRRCRKTTRCRRE